jgi:hypothetical protein
MLKRQLEGISKLVKETYLESTDKRAIASPHWPSQLIVGALLGVSA